jgi:hypothetical protein
MIYRSMEYLLSNTSHQLKNTMNIVKCGCDKRYANKSGSVGPGEYITTCDCDRNNFRTSVDLLGGNGMTNKVSDSNITDHLYPISDSASPFVDVIDSENNNENTVGGKINPETMPGVSPIYQLTAGGCTVTPDQAGGCMVTPDQAGGSTIQSGNNYTNYKNSIHYTDPGTCLIQYHWAKHDYLKLCLTQ